MRNGSRAAEESRKIVTSAIAGDVDDDVAAVSAGAPKPIVIMS